MARPVDTVELCALDGSGSLDNFTSLSITNDLTMPSEAAFELGDDWTWDSMEDILKPGKQYRVFVNGSMRLTGRVELQDNPADAMGGSPTRFTIRTKLADAMTNSAEPATRVKNVSIRQFLISLYSPLGYTADDFVFKEDVSRDLMTGVKAGAKRRKPKKFATAKGAGQTARVNTSHRSADGKKKLQFARNIEKITIDQAKVQMSEMIYDAADRHLRRHGLMHWDCPDGRIVVGAPYDEQDPLYYLRYCKLDNPHLNNVLSATRAKDYSGVPSAVVVYGFGALKGLNKDKIVGMVKDDDLYNAGFHRPLILSSDSMRNNEMAETAARRELAARSKRKDCYTIESDGLSFWDGESQIAWGIDTVCSVTSDVAKIESGAYYIHAINLTRNASEGDKTSLSAVKRGIWVL